ncbi:VOC family protein [Desulfogranum japonicum]|uniref:VOC family protein n=1 Tax=Desulfogranum japonicum TaxID=231447 RepID=UPI000402DF49|nr:VOC family protein [Desulfogranum japonicum]
MRFAHTNIAANDWKKLADFYINVFECRIKPPIRNLEGEWLNNATGLQNAKLQGVHLTLPGHGDNPPTLEIFTYEEMVESPESMANSTGITHIAFEVNDVKAIFDKALENGATQLGSIVEREVENVGVLQFVYFRDPEGNIVEIQSWK